MGLLDPLIEKTEEGKERTEVNIDLIEEVIDTLNNHRGAIVNGWDEVNELEVYEGWMELPIADIDHPKLIDLELDKHRMLLSKVKRDAVGSRLANSYAEEFDFDLEDVESYEALEKLNDLHQDLSSLPRKVNEMVEEKLGVDHRNLNEMDKTNYEIRDGTYLLSEKFDALPVIEGVVESQEKIEDEMDRILEEMLEEHEEHKRNINSNYERVEFPTTPVDWSVMIDETVEEESLQDYIDHRGIISAGPGDVLHQMMEEYFGGLEELEAEYALHFTNPGDIEDTPKMNRIDNTVRSDAINDFLVYEFKHMPEHQKQHLQENGDLKIDQKFIDNVKQLNGYLNDLDMPVGMLVHISSDLEVNEYVVERHEVDNWNNYEEEFDLTNVYPKEIYEFDKIPKNF